MSAAARRLLLLRHAEARSLPGLRDHQRPLSSAGTLAAVALGVRLRAKAVLPDSVLCSPALRTRQTWEAMALPEDTLHLEAELYGASAAELRARCTALATELRCVLLIGHNPGISALAAELARPADSAQPGGAAEASSAGSAELAELARGLRPCAMAEFALAADWAGLAAPGGASLLALHQPVSHGARGPG